MKTIFEAEDGEIFKSKPQAELYEFLVSIRDGYDSLKKYNDPELIKINWERVCKQTATD